MDKARKILAAAGQFPQDDPVLARAAEMARAHRARLTVAHVVDRLTAFDSMSTDLERIQGQLRLMAREDIEAAVARQHLDLHETDIRIEAGSPAPRLIELSNEIGPDLVVMRAHQGDSIVAKIIGSTTDRMIRAAGVPVLVVKRPVTQAYQRVVVAADTTDESAAAVSFAAALFPSAALHLIHVVHISHQFEEAMRRAGYGLASVAAHRDALIRNAKAYMHDMSNRLADRSVRTTTRVIVGDPAKSLARATRGPKVDLIVVGPGSTGLIQWALLGSVTRELLRMAACDVLVFRPAAPGPRG